MCIFELVAHFQRISIFTWGICERIISLIKLVLENMSISINGITNINEISRSSFAEAAKEAGIGSKIAMARFDDMVAGFSDALTCAKEELLAQGFAQVEEIAEMIMRRFVEL